MKGTVLLASALAILMLLGLCAAASAWAGPQQGTFTLGVLEFAIDQGEQFLTGNILHIRDSVGVSAFSELPWGTAITATEVVISAQGDINTGIGSATSKTVDVYPSGTVVGTVQTELAGAGFWTYLGPPLTFNGRTIETGQVFFGVYTNIMAVKHGVSGELKGLVTKETATGVTELDSNLKPTGWAVAYATGMYGWLR